VIGRNRVVITGLGVLAANGIGKEAFWNSLLAGESGIGPITQFDTSEIPWKIAGEVKNFVPEDFIGRELKPRRQSRNTQMAAAAASMAVQDANLSKSVLMKSPPLQVILGISLGGLDLVEQHTRRLIDRGLNKGLPTVSSCVHVIASSFIASMLKVPTQLNVISNSCTGGLDAIAQAAGLIRDGKASIALAGGTDAVIIPSVVTGLGYAGMLTEETNLNACRPFDLMRTGGVLSEGAGIVVLESYEHATTRGASLYAEVLGHGTASSVDILVSEGLELCMERAVNNSNIQADDVAYINAHGTSDPLLDVAETRAIKNVFRKSAYGIPISSIKGATGNPLSAGGAIQTIATALTLSTSTIPQTTNYSVPDPDCDLDYVMLSSRKTNPSIALINSHGTGGVNSSLVLESI